MPPINTYLWLLNSPFYRRIKSQIIYFIHRFKVLLAVCVHAHLCVNASALYEGFLFCLFVLFYWPFGSVCVFN